MRRITHSIGIRTSLISIAIAVAAAIEPLAAWAGQGSPGGV
jgi:hypothetical protein